MTEITEAIRTQIVLAAVHAAGPNASDAAIAFQAGRITGFLHPSSTVQSAIASTLKQAERIISSGGFEGTLVYVDLEETSQRGYLLVQTEPSNDYPDGIEPVRTHRWDSKDGEQWKAFTNEAMGLIGHRVWVDKIMEKGTGANTRDMRIVVGLTDRGIDQSFPQGLPLRDYADRIDWSKNGREKVAPKLARLKKFRAAA